MWQAKYFHPFLTGSVIVFLRLQELKEVIARHEENARAAKFTAAIKKVNQLAAHEKNIRQQLQLLQQLKVALLRQQLQ